MEKNGKGKRNEGQLNTGAGGAGGAGPMPRRTCW